MRACHVVFLLLAPALSGAAPPTPPPSLLILPIDAKQGVEPDAAELVTVLMAGIVREVVPHRVVTYREIEGAVNQEMRLQIAGCDSASCAAEIAGALDADEILMGTLGKLGSSVVLSASRVRARDATVVGNAIRQLRVADDAEIADALPDVVADLFPERRAEVRRRYPPGAPRSVRAGAIRVEVGDLAPDPDTPSLLDPIRRPLRVVSGVLAGGGGALWALAAVAGLLLLCATASWALVIGTGNRDTVLGFANPQLLVLLQLLSILAVIVAAPLLLASVAFSVVAVLGLAGLGFSFL